MQTDPGPLAEHRGLASAAPGPARAEAAAADAGGAAAWACSQKGPPLTGYPSIKPPPGLPKAP